MLHVSVLPIKPLKRLSIFRKLLWYSIFMCGVYKTTQKSVGITLEETKGYDFIYTSKGCCSFTFTHNSKIEFRSEKLNNIFNNNENQWTYHSHNLHKHDKVNFTFPSFSYGFFLKIRICYTMIPFFENNGLKHEIFKE